MSGCSLVVVLAARVKAGETGVQNWMIPVFSCTREILPTRKERGVSKSGELCLLKVGCVTINRARLHLTTTAFQNTEHTDAILRKTVRKQKL